MPVMYNFGVVMPRAAHGGAVWMCRAYIHNNQFVWEAGLTAGDAYEDTHTVTYNPAVLAQGNYVAVQDLTPEEMNHGMAEGIKHAQAWVDSLPNLGIQEIIWARPSLYLDHTVEPGH